MNAFSEGLWHDLAGSGIHVAIVNPGPIDTEIWEKTGIGQIIGQLIGHVIGRSPD